MAVARTTRETFDFVLEADRALPPEQQTVFHLRSLSQATMMAIENLMTIDPSMATMSLRSGDQKLLVLRAGLAGWTRFMDADGVEVPFRAEPGRRSVFGTSIDSPAAMECIERLRTSDAREIADAIILGNQLTKTDVKN